MPVIAQDKPLESLRNQTIDQLIMNYGHGELSLEAFERRLDQALDATDHEVLQRLTADLDLEVDDGYIQKKKEELGLHYPPRSPEDVEYIVSVFSASDRAGTWHVPEEVRVITVFGAADLDFSDARFSSRTTRVKMLCIFGAVDIFVRDDVSTTVKTLCVFGAIDNKVPATDNPDPSKLVIEGLVLFGAVDAKIKRTLKERLFEFADGLRTMFSQGSPPKRR